MIEDFNDEKTTITFCEESIQISRPKNYEELIEIIQNQFNFGPSEMNNLIFYYLNEESEPVCAITSNSYDKFKLRPCLNIKIAISNDYDEEGIRLGEDDEEVNDKVLDKDEKNEILEKIIEETKQKIRARNSEIITQSGLMEPNISNDLEHFIITKLNDKGQELEKLIETSVTEFTKKLELQKKEKKEEGELESQKKEVELSEHFAKCNGCNCQKIKGIRYKCLICSSFNYCEKCESTFDHPHPFYKLKYPIEELM